jgi:hypothetical protein
MLSDKSGQVMFDEHQIDHVFHLLGFRIDLQTPLADNFLDAFYHLVVITGFLHDATHRICMKLVQSGAPLQITLLVHRKAAARDLPALDVLGAYRQFHRLRCFGNIAWSIAAIAA